MSSQSKAVLHAKKGTSQFLQVDVCTLIFPHFHSIAKCVYLTVSCLAPLLLRIYSWWEEHSKASVVLRTSTITVFRTDFLFSYIFIGFRFNIHNLTSGKVLFPVEII